MGGTVYGFYRNIYLLFFFLERLEQLSTEIIRLSVQYITRTKLPIFLFRWRSVCFCVLRRFLYTSSARGRRIHFSSPLARKYERDRLQR